MSFNLDDAIGKIPNFPKEGIGFFDITKLLSNPDAFQYCLDTMEKLYEKEKLDAIAAVEARGFFFGAPLADRLKVPFIPLRKKGKLPGEVLSKSFMLEYGEDSIEVRGESIPKGGKVLLVDDLIATGGTLRAGLDLLRENGAIVEDIFCIIGLPFLNYDEKFKDVRIKTLIEYFSEDFE